MKRPIDVADIRAGDLIRWEGECDSAREWRSASNATPWSTEAGQHYILTSPVKLLWPAGTALWLTRDFCPWSKGDEVCLAEDWYEDAGVGATTTSLYGRPLLVTLAGVTDTPPTPAVELPATAVPTEALDALRAEHGDDQLGACYEVIVFLAAVDAANRADR